MAAQKKVQRKRAKSSKRILVTGAAGLVGQNLMFLLEDTPHQIIAIDKNVHNLRLLQDLHPDLETHCVDLAVKGDWEKLFKGVDVLIDLHAQIAAPTLTKFTRNNVQAEKTVLAACKKHKVPYIIHMSSSVVISVADDDYTNTKKKGEELVKKSGIPYTILRPPLMYGCFDGKHLGWLTKLLELSPVFPIPGSGRYMRQPLYVMDLCAVIMSALKKGPTNTCHNIIGHERIDFIDIMREIALQRKLVRAIVPTPLPVFVSALKTYSVFTGKPAFTKQQLDALMAGDDFPVENWTKKFGVAYTPFRKALKQTYSSKYYWKSRRIASPH